MADFETREIEQLPAAASLPADALTIVQQPGGPAQRISVGLLMSAVRGVDLATETLAELNANLTPPDKAMAVVYADPDEDASGFYLKSGGPGVGTWAKLSNLTGPPGADGEDGEDGAPGTNGNDGIDGTDGKWIEFVWKRAAAAPAAPEGNGIPAGWSDNPPADNGQPLWMSRAKQELDGTLIGAWSNPIRHNGPPGPAGDDGPPGDDGIDALTIPPPPTVDIACYSDGSIKPGQLPAYAQINVYVGNTDVTELSAFADGARANCSSGVSNVAGTRGVVTFFTDVTADTAWAEFGVSYGGRAAALRINVAKRKDATSPAASYPAESIDIGTTTYTKSIPVPNGATISLNTEAHSNFPSASAGSMSVSASRSVHDSGVWNVMSTGSPTTSSFAPGEPADVSAVWTWTNTTGAAVLIDVRVTISKTGGALTMNTSRSYMQPQ